MSLFNKQTIKVIKKQQSDNSSQSSELSEGELERLKQKRIVKKSNVLFNQQVSTKPKKEKKEKEEQNNEETKQERYLLFSQNELESQMTKQKKKNKRLKNPLNVFKHHKMPQIDKGNYSILPNRYFARNTHELKFPNIQYPNQDSDVRLMKDYEPYLRQVIFDHNQVKKSASTPAFDSQMVQYRQQFAEYKQWIDYQDEINRLSALNKYGAYYQNNEIQPQYNLRSVKLYPPQYQAENMYKNYIPPSQYLTQNQEQFMYQQQLRNQSTAKPRFLPIIPLNLR